MEQLLDSLIYQVNACDWSALARSGGRGGCDSFWAPKSIKSFNINQSWRRFIDIKIIHQEKVKKQPQNLLQWMNEQIRSFRTSVERRMMMGSDLVRVWIDLPERIMTLNVFGTLVHQQKDPKWDQRRRGKTSTLIIWPSSLNYWLVEY